MIFSCVVSFFVYTSEIPDLSLPPCTIWGTTAGLNCPDCLYWPKPCAFFRIKPKIISGYFGSQYLCSQTTYQKGVKLTDAHFICLCSDLILFTSDFEAKGTDPAEVVVTCTLWGGGGMLLSPVRPGGRDDPGISLLTLFISKYA
jgi:hypothetical protein